MQDNRLVDLPLSTPFLKLMCHGEIHNNVNERIGLLPGTNSCKKSIDDDLMVSSYISEESEKDWDSDPLKGHPDDSKPW